VLKLASACTRVLVSHFNYTYLLQWSPTGRGSPLKVRVLPVMFGDIQSRCSSFKVEAITSHHHAMLTLERKIAAYHQSMNPLMEDLSSGIYTREVKGINIFMLKDFSGSETYFRTFINQIIGL